MTGSSEVLAVGEAAAAVHDDWFEGTSQKSPSLAEAARLIHEVEERYDLLRYEVDGWCAWPIVRFAVLRRILDAPQSTAKSDMPRIGRTLSLFGADLPRIRRLRPARYVFFSYASNRSDEENGLALDIFYDDLIRELETNAGGRSAGTSPVGARPPGGESPCMKMEVADNPLFDSGRGLQLIPATIGTTFVSVWSNALARCGVPRAISQISRRMGELLKQGLGVQSFSLGYLELQITKFFWRKRLYGMLLNRIRPQYLLLVTSYADHAVVAAAKERGIKVVELQHGHIPKEHPGYSWTSYASPYKRKMPIPDSIFVYGTFWLQQLLSFGFWKDEVIATGSVQMDRYRKRPRRPLSDSLCLTFTAQGVDTEKVIRFLNEFLRLVDRRKGLRMYIKLHPSQRDKQVFVQGFRNDADVTVVGANEPPATFQLISMSDLHISIYSTCHYEALALGVPTAILPFRDHEICLDLLQSKYAAVATSPAVLAQLLSSSKGLEVSGEVGDYYFAPGALQSMKRALAVD